MAARSAVRRKKPLLRLMDAAVAHASVLSWLLLALGTLGMLAVPLAGRKIFFDENSLLVGSARAYIRCAMCYTRQGIRLRPSLDHLKMGV